jgi:putative transposase
MGGHNTMVDPELALWRFSLIAPLLHRAPGVSLTQMARQLAAEIKSGRDGTPVLVSAETLLRWLRHYQQGGLAALDNQPRADRGRCRALDPDTVAALHELVALHPEWTVKALHRQLQRDRGRALPLKPMYRLLQRRQRLTPPDAPRHRPPGVPQVLWLADTMHGPAVYGPRRRKAKSFLLAVLDDASRAVMGGAVALHDDVQALMPVLRDAVLTRGLPHRLLVDNGANYRSRVLRTAAARLGVHLLYATPYQATAKARLERFFLTVRLQLLPRLPAFPTLAQLQTEWARFLAEYHATPHSTLTALTGRPTTPLDYYLAFLPPDVQYPQALDLAELFLVEVTRRVNADATIRLATRSWEVRAELVGQRVLARYNPDDPQRVLYRPVLDPQVAFAPAFPVL